jgi:hypothetical protein
MSQDRFQPYRVAVITPYFDTPDDWLRQCHESVRTQTYPCTHIMVADGRPQACVSGFDAQHIVLPVRHADFGDSPRAVGSMSAIGQGFDAIAYLDADNWYDPDHIESLIKLHEATRAPILTSRRSLHRLDGSYMALCLTSDGEQFCDTSCLMLMRPAFHLASVWALMDPSQHPIDDRVVWQRILQSGLARAHTGKPSVGYRATLANFYHHFREEPPAGARVPVEVTRAADKWVREGNPPLQYKHEKYAFPRTPSLLQAGFSQGRVTLENIVMNQVPPPSRTGRALVAFVHLAEVSAGAESELSLKDPSGRSLATKRETIAQPRKDIFRYV